MEDEEAGEYCRAESLPKIAETLIEVEDDMSVYDACCGTGILVNSVANGKGGFLLKILCFNYRNCCYYDNSKW